ncbi:unnamed protein product [Miscanthus lutarioriparius]|uniref:Uncharacterized protein n=1 Tax=Miscanthus lutarioriparius TaxID=422564 RepID=A0A811R0C8_9POAL|nr:unnamed protein product [Miscanthus lutarioriparius]
MEKMCAVEDATGGIVMPSLSSPRPTSLSSQRPASLPSQRRRVLLPTPALGGSDGRCSHAAFEFARRGAGGMRLRLWSVATVVREAGAQGGDGEGSPARQKSSNDEGSVARQKSSDGEGNASMHGSVWSLLGRC